MSSLEPNDLKELDDLKETDHAGIANYLEKSLQKRLYLIDAEMLGINNWKFIIEGSTEFIYTILINDKLSCSCLDFSNKKLICRHINFIIKKVLKNSEINKILNGETNISIFSQRINLDLNEKFNNNLNPRFRHRFSIKESEEFIDFNEICSVCFENLENENLLSCKSCHNYFHEICINIWLSKGIRCSCPMCRNYWV